MNPRIAKRLTACLLLVFLPWACARSEADSAAPPDLSGYRICVDPGHQAHMDSRLEPVSPFDRSEKKARTAGGARGVVTRVDESERNLEIALKLAEWLRACGAEVLLTRETEDVTLSNIGRARMANDFQADVFLRLHCNKSDNPKRRGLCVYAPILSANRFYDTKKAQMLEWAEALGARMQEESGAPSHKVVANNQYTGSNWAQMPSFLIEMGYMSNAEDDLLLADPDYQQGLIRGIARFLATMPKAVYRDNRALPYP